MKTPITLDVVQKIIAEHIGIALDNVKPDSTLDSLDVDSLDVMEIIMSIEDECNCAINDDKVISVNGKLLINCTVTKFTDILTKVSV